MWIKNNCNNGLSFTECDGFVTFMFNGDYGHISTSKELYLQSVLKK